MTNQHEPTAAQQQYWHLSRAYAVTRDALHQAANDASLAETAFQAFETAHDGETFYAFRPDDIAAALTADVEPFWP